MHLKELILEGFKSYSSKTVIKNFDTHFNAITGLNGSGKSNILDAIIFVLGITGYKDLRAQEIKDLIYKQGTAGITSATVTAVFDNSNPDFGPVSYRDCPLITVSRTVTVSNKNTYTINGTRATIQKVHNMFQSVQLNVKNPHFLIMQGRIIRVCNMRPPQLLSLIEETIGTRMYEDKRTETINMLAKKSKKLEDTQAILEELTQTQEQYKGQLAKYNEYNSFLPQVQSLERLIIAYRYYSSLRRQEALNIERATQIQQKAEIESNIVEKQSAIELLKTKLEELRQTQLSNSSQALYNDLRDHQSNLVVAESNLKTLRTTIEQEEKERKALEAQLDAITLQMEQLEKDGIVANENLQRIEVDYNKLKLHIDSIQSSLLGVSSAGGAAGAGGGSLLEQKMDAERELTQIKSNIDGVAQQIRQLQEDRQQEVRRQGMDEQLHTSLASSITKLESELEVNQQEIDRVAKELCSAHGYDSLNTTDALDFIRSKFQQKQAEYNALEAELQDIERKRQQMELQLGPRLQFYHKEHPNIDVGGIYGVFAKLIKIINPKFSLALEIAGGGRLFNIVLKHSDIGKNLFKFGGLRSRVSFLPLNAMRQSRPLTPQEISAAKAKGNGTGVYTALELVSSLRPEVQAATDYVFGGIFICEDNRVANAIASDPAIRRRAVTLQGDDYNPNGSVSGGSAARDNGILTRLQQLAQLEQAMGQKKQQLETMQRDVLQPFQAVYSLLDEMNEKRQLLAQHTSRLAHSSYAMSQKKIDQYDANISRLDDQLKLLQEGKTKLEERITMLQGTITALESGGSSKKALQDDLKQQKKQLVVLQNSMNAARDVHERIIMQNEELEAQGKDLLDSIEESEQAGRDSQSKYALARQKVEDCSQLVRTMQARIDKAKQDEETASAKQRGVRKLIAENETELVSLQAALEQHIQLAEKHKAEEKHLIQLIKTLSSDHKWILTESGKFGVAKGEYDFSDRDLPKLEHELRDLQGRLKQLERYNNPLIASMSEKITREHADLMQKLDIIRRDRDGIERSIQVLDEKKSTTLDETFRVVNERFGSIFSILLPGAGARLKRHITQKGVLHGVEMQVSFNGRFKESLSELSGGQRSLLALSLILALLRFKPAPLYILDEVDAALDASHTQNIGQTIKKYFTQSQFIIVSLKEGMFENANMLIRTQLTPNGSTITITRKE